MAENKKGGTSSLGALISAGKEEAEKVKNIKSVAATPEEQELVLELPTIVETTKSSIASTIEQEEQASDNIEISKDPTLSGLSMLFTKREVKDTEAVKIPREFHRELKLLSSMSGTSMMQMIGNLIESFLEENQKEIANYKRKYINGTLGKK